MTGSTRKKILIVEDDESTSELILLTLRQLDVELHAVCNGEDAITTAGSWQPDAVVTDVQLPGAMNGYDICRHLKDNMPQVKVTIVTTRQPYSDAATIIAVGADAYLMKPFSPSQLLDTVAALLA